MKSWPRVVRLSRRVLFNMDGREGEEVLASGRLAGGQSSLAAIEQF